MLARVKRRVFHFAVFWENLQLVVKSTKPYIVSFCTKDMIQIFGFPELIFCVDYHFAVSKSKKGAWWDVYFFMLIFRLFFILADKISRFAKSWLPIQNLNLVARSEIPYLNWRYDFVTFSHNFCQNAWTSSLCTHANNGVFPISTVVMWTRNA